MAFASCAPRYWEFAAAHTPLYLYMAPHEEHLARLHAATRRRMLVTVEGKVIAAASFDVPGVAG